MRKVLFVASAVCLLATAFAVTASASEDAWTIYFEVGTGGTFGDIQNYQATAQIESTTLATVIDDPSVKDPRDGQSPPSAMNFGGFAQWYRPWNADGGYGMFIRDSRRPLSTQPNLVKTWSDLVIWGAHGLTDNYPVDTLTVFISAKGVPNTVGGKVVAYKLVMTSAPEGYAGQREWILPASPGADSTLKTGWFQFSLPAAGAIVGNGLKPISGTGALAATQTAGYRFSLVTPEPGSMMVLASGLVGLVGLVSRRRSA